MKCAYCLTDFHAKSYATQLDFLQSPKLNTLEFAEFYIFTTVCSKCFGAHIYLRTRKSGTNQNLDYRLVQPRVGGSSRHHQRFLPTSAPTTKKQTKYLE